MTTTLSRMSMMGRRAWRTMAAASGRRRVAAAVAMAMLLGLVAGVPLLRAAEAGAAAPAGKTADAHDDHAGHDHGPAPATKAAAAAAHDDHAGHDHGPAPATKAAEAAADDHDDHDGHDHGPAPATRAAEAAADDHDDHAGHDHGAEGHEDEGVTLSDAERRNAGIVVAAAGPGDLATEVRLRGEIALNRDRVVHVIPLVAGVAREIRATEGDAVEAGQVLAVLDSSELAEAKLDYLTKVNEVLCCDLLVPRAKAVHDGTRRLLDFLAGNPPLDSLQAFDAGEAGENLKTLLGAYAELAQARQAFERERGLHQKEITSGQEYFAAKTAYEKAAAEYRAARDSASFQVRQELAEAEAMARAARFAARTAEQRLRIMGLSAEAVQRLDALVLPEKPCDDPNCKDCATGASAEEREHAFGNGFASYEVRAPIAGRIVERHLSLGEKVGEDSDLFTVADTATVWAELTVHLRDLAALEVGAEVTIEAQHAAAATRGRIAMLSPTVDTATRTATARVVIENDSGEWRPGVFVTGVVRVAAQSLPVVLPRQAVETVDGQAVVFVARGDAFMPVPVETGLSDRERVEVVSGLSAGTPVVVKGAFAIKAKRVTSTLDSHAGHGH